MKSWIIGAAALASALTATPALAHDAVGPVDRLAGGSRGATAVSEVLAWGYTVRAIARSEDRVLARFGDQVELVTANVEDAATLGPALAGVDSVVLTLDQKEEVRIQADRIFPNCPRYIHRMALVERSSYVPRAGIVTPIPEWKRGELAAGVLPEGDRAAQDGAPGG